MSYRSIPRFNRVKRHVRHVPLVNTKVQRVNRHVINVLLVNTKVQQANRHVINVPLVNTKVQQANCDVRHVPLVNTKVQRVNRHVINVLQVNTKVQQANRHVMHVLLVNTKVQQVKRHVRHVLLVNTKVQQANRRVGKCAIGKYQGSTGKTSCASCAIGQYQGSTGQSSCASCAIGQYQGSTGKTSCASCAIGQYQGSTGQSSCGSCPTGKYQGSTGQSSCDKCLVGQYNSVAGSSMCKMCVVGMYQPDDEQSNCKPCDTDKVTGVPSGATSCAVGCPNGYFANGQIFCTKCAEGKYINGEASCKTCSNDQPNSDGISCFKCLPGRYKRSCTVCPIGRYTGWETEILNECHLCDTGYQDEEGQGNCKTCPFGRVLSFDHADPLSDDYTTCITCPRGEYADQENLNTCKKCSTGQHTGIIGQKEDECTSDNIKGQHEYSRASVSEYGFQSTLKKVIDETYTAFISKVCDGNKYHNMFNSDKQCKSCPVGLFKQVQDRAVKIIGPNDFNVCTFCPPGKRNVDSASERCTACTSTADKRVLVDFPHQECRYSACPEGSFAKSGKCPECPTGTYWESNPVVGIPLAWGGVGVFHSCSQFTNQLGPYLAPGEQEDWHVEQCEKGLTTGICVGNEPVVCVKGKELREEYFKSAPRKYDGLCRSCPLGQYQDNVGRSSCKYCHTATEEGSISCS